MGRAADSMKPLTLTKEQAQRIEESSAGGESMHESWITNREKRRQPKRGKFWCWSCDMALVHESGKCPVCGNENRSRKRNKR